MSDSLQSPINVMIVEIHPEQSNAALFQVVRSVSGVMDAMHEAGLEYVPPFLTIAGFDRDPRNVCHIPGAVETVKRAVDAGFLSVLFPSVLFAKQMGMHISFGRCEAFGALELWLLASNRFNVDGGMVEVNLQEVRHFLRDVVPNENQQLRERLAWWRMEGGEA